MNHYARLGVVAVRLFAFVLVLIGAMGLLYTALLAAAGTLPPEQRERASAAPVYLVAAVVLYAFSRPLGRLIGRGLEPPRET
ncbi:MAG TPA: hypothetical protein VF746_09925 [Longimicrobium sp.]|jgi:hypothetical protein